MEQLHSYWFSNPDIWFGCGPEVDMEITEKFSELLHNEIQGTSIQNIILYDQISRHIFRNNKERISYYHEKALCLAFQLIMTGKIEELTPEERCFALLPLRHTFNIENLEICLMFIKKWRDINDTNIYRRFYKATIDSLGKVKNQLNTIADLPMIDFKKILDPNSPDFPIESFKRLPRDHDMIKNFNLKYRGDIIVSLSGGVDSMVALFITKNIPGLNPIAVSINYGNRAEQDLEMVMVNQFCKKIGVTHHIRKITEIQRNKYDREIYEEVTRNIRFGMYQKLNLPVILGHNKDDSLENIFSNIKKQRNYDNLFGMSFESEEKGIKIFRPLLSVFKKDIYNFAKEFNIPFVYDSTPSWSERGQMRDILLPAINNFNPQILEGLVKMVENYQQIYKVYQNSLPNITFGESQCELETNVFFFDYWKKILYKIQIHYQTNPITNKTIKNTVMCLNRGDKKVKIGENLFLFKKNEGKFEIKIYK